MGLDNYAVRNAEIQLDPTWGDIVIEVEELTPDDIDDVYDGLGLYADKIIRGIFANAPHCIRGKWYSPLVENITGVSMYEAYLPPTIVRAVYHRLRDTNFDELTHEQLLNWHSEEFTREDFDEVTAYFEAIAPKGFGLVSWS